MAMRSYTTKQMGDACEMLRVDFKGALEGEDADGGSVVQCLASVVGCRSLRVLRRSNFGKSCVAG